MHIILTRYMHPDENCIKEPIAYPVLVKIDSILFARPILQDRDSYHSMDGKHNTIILQSVDEEDTLAVAESLLEIAELMSDVIVPEAMPYGAALRGMRAWREKQQKQV